MQAAACSAMVNAALTKSFLRTAKPCLACGGPCGKGTMQDAQQLWLSWSRGEVDDATASAAAEQIAADTARAFRKRQTAAIERDRKAAEQEGTASRRGGRSGRASDTGATPTKRTSAHSTAATRQVLRRRSTEYRSTGMPRSG